MKISDYLIVIFPIICVLIFLFNPLIAQTDKEAESLFLHALDLDYKGEKDSALIAYKNLIAEKPDYSTTYRHATKLFLEAKRVDEAKVFFNNQLQKYPGNGYIYYCLARIEKFLGNNNKSVEFLKKCISLRPDYEEAYGPFGGMGDVYESEGKYELALNSYRKALKLTKNKKYFLIRTYFCLYDLYIEMGQSVKAAKTKNNLYDLSDNFSPEFTSIIEYQLSQYDYIAEKLFYLEGGENIRSLKIIKKMFNIAIKLGNSFWVKYTNEYLGSYKIFYGDYRFALSCFQKSLNITKVKGYNQIFSLFNIGFIYLDLGYYKKSLNYFDKVKQLIVNDKQTDYNKFLIVAINSHIGWIYVNTNQCSLALRNFNTGLKLYSENPSYYSSSSNNRLYPHLLLGISECHLKLKNYKLSNNYLEKALKYSILKNNEPMKAESYMMLAKISAHKNCYDNAIENYYEALQIQKKHFNKQNFWRSELGLGEAYLKAGKKKDSIYHLKNVVTYFDSLRQGLYMSSVGKKLLEEQYKAYNLLALLYAEGKEFSKSFSVIENYKSKALLSSLTIDGPFISQLFGDSNSLKIKEVNNQLEELHNQISIIKDSEKIFYLKNHLVNLELKKAALYDTLRKDYPIAFQELSSEPVSIESLQKNILNDNNTLIQFMVGEHDLLVYAIKKNDILYKKLQISASDLRKCLSKISSIYRFEESKELDFNTNILNAQVANFSIPPLYDLYCKIIKPLRPFINDSDELIIIPDDMLFYLPFEALVVDTNRAEDHYDFGNAKFLINDYAISYAPSASLLSLKLKNDSKTDLYDLLAMGNPDYSGLELVDTINFKSDSYVRGMKNLQPLPFSQYEVIKISEILGKTKTKLFINKDATEENFKAYAKDSRILHLATHFMTNDEDPIYSKIALTKNPNSIEDGLLQPYEILNMDLNADLVVLSACNTALGKINRGEGFVGVSRAFHYAGVPSLLLSQWNVDDKATSIIMMSFYKYLEQGYNKSNAIRQAKLDFFKSVDKRYKDPFYWAPFIIIGDVQPMYNKNNNIIVFIIFIFISLAVLKSRSILKFKYFR